MKVHIINLDPNDDVSSARDKLSWVKSPRVILVWPEQGSVLTSRLDLMLVQRFVHAHGMQLGLVTFDSDVRRHAKSLAIPIFSSLDQQNEEAWPSEKEAMPLERRELLTEDLTTSRHQEQVNHSRITERWQRVLRIGSLALALTAMAALLCVIVPAAEVLLTPETVTKDRTIQILLDPEIENVQGNHIPTREVSVHVIDSMRKPTTGTVNIGIQAAHGIVVFNNLTLEELSIPIGTAVRTADGVRFTTLEKAELAGGLDSFCAVEGVADEPGKAGNVAAQAIIAVDGALGLKVTATNPDAMTGGVNGKVNGVSFRDRFNLRQALLDSLYKQAAAEIEAGLSPNEHLAPGSMRIMQTYSEQYNYQPGEVTEVLELTLDIEIAGLVYDDMDVQQVAIQTFNEELESGWAKVPESLRINQPGQVLELADSSVYEVEVSQGVYQTVSEERLRRDLRGHSLDEASFYLSKSLELALPPKIQIMPALWPRMPLVEARIRIEWDWENK
jgi:hypothetical protein